MNNVKILSEHNLCMGCGTCQSLCPNLAITIAKSASKGIYYPLIDEMKCNYCSLCLSVCPGINFDFKGMYEKFFGEIPEDIWLGINKGIYIGYSLDHSIRSKSSSGGLITELLIFSLEEGFIDGALITKMSETNPLEPKVVIARSKEEILSAMGSKYCPVPANIGLREIINSNKNEKFAVVGLPCHIQGIRKSQLFNDALANKIVFIFGLMCSNNTTFLGTEYFIRKMGVDPTKVNQFSYKKEGWLPKKQISMIIGKKEKILGFDSKNFLKSFPYLVLDNSTFHHNFVIPRCLTCCDHTAEFSDISFGDPRIPEIIKADKLGHSLILLRTDKGKELFFKAISKGRIELVKDLNTEEFYKCQNPKFKKKFNSRIYLLKLLKKPIPQYSLKYSQPNFIELFDLFRYFPSYISHKKFIWYFLFPYSLMNSSLKLIFSTLKYKLKNRKN